MNTLHKSFCGNAFSFPKSGTTGLQSVGMSNFTRTCSTVFQSGCTNLHSHQCMRCHIATHPCQLANTFLFIYFFFQFSPSSGVLVVWHCVVCISRTTNGDQHLSIMFIAHLGIISCTVSIQILCSFFYWVIVLLICNSLHIRNMMHWECLLPLFLISYGVFG